MQLRPWGSSASLLDVGVHQQERQVRKIPLAAINQYRGSTHLQVTLESSKFTLIPSFIAIMRIFFIALCTSVLHAIQVLAAFRPDLRENVQVAELEPEQNVPDSATEIPMKAYPGSDFEIVFKCVEASKLLTFSDCKTWVACCLPGQRLLKSEIAMVFDCCKQDEDLVGSKNTGFGCCSPGLEFDGIGCRHPGKKDPLCPRGEVPVNGQCVCPLETVRGIDGTCQVLECSSGIQSGKQRMTQ